MITDADIEKMKAVFTTKENLELLSNKFETKFATKEDSESNTEHIINAMIEMIDGVNEKLDKVLDRTITNKDELQDHENRIRKVENKIFVI